MRADDRDATRRRRGVNNGYVAESVRQGFTGYEEDAETGLDYAQARYYANGQRRFTAVDPLNVANPQTWNRYSQTINKQPGTPTGRKYGGRRGN